MINYDAAAGVSVLTEPGPKTQSALAIRRAAPRHSGNYTCRAANTEPAHIYVYVSEGSEWRCPVFYNILAFPKASGVSQNLPKCYRRQDGGYAKPQQ